MIQSEQGPIDNSLFSPYPATAFGNTGITMRLTLLLNAIGDFIGDLIL